MDSFIRRVSYKCSNYIVDVGNEVGQIMTKITYEKWLMLSALAVIVGFVLLRGNR